MRATLGARKYLGGLLLVDEVDATLHPLAQENLIKLLIKECDDLDLQFVATTHSQYLLKLATTEMKNKLHVIFLENKSGEIVEEKIDSYQQIEEKLQQRMHSQEKVKHRAKPTILIEDDAAKDFLSYLLGSRVMNCFPVGAAGTIIAMSRMNIPELANALFIVDGDKASEVQKMKRKTRLVALPGSTYPEKIIFDYLYALPETDGIFKEMPQRSLFRDYGAGLLKKDQYKAWYSRYRRFFGTNARRVFARWGQDHMDAIRNFVSKIEKIASKNQIGLTSDMFQVIRKRHRI